MRKSESISISLMPDVLEMLDELTARQHSSRSKCITDLIRQKYEMKENYENSSKSITFSRVAQSGQYISHISIAAMAVLTAMIEIMPTNNHVMLTLQNIMDFVSSIGNRTTASKAIKELLDSGCVAIARKGNTQTATVYMVNPMISSVGVEKTYLQHLFWQYTGDTTNDDGDTEYSAAHCKWIEINKSTYAVENCRLKEAQCKNMIHDANGNIQMEYSKFVSL